MPGFKSSGKDQAVSVKHHKTINDVHGATLVSVKFSGDLMNSKVFHIVSCDVNGLVYLTTFTDKLLSLSTFKFCLVKHRMGTVYSLAPHLVGAFNY